MGNEGKQWRAMSGEDLFAERCRDDGGKPWKKNGAGT